MRIRRYVIVKIVKSVKDFLAFTVSLVENVIMQMDLEYVQIAIILLL
jgi:uncharacterized protein (UPF0212 family)